MKKLILVLISFILVQANAQDIEEKSRMSSGEKALVAGALTAQVWATERSMAVVNNFTKTLATFAESRPDLFEKSQPVKRGLRAFKVFRVVAAAKLALAGYTGLQIGKFINEMDEKYADGVITHNNIVVESIGRGLEAARVFQSYDYVANGDFSNDLLLQTEEAINVLKELAKEQ